jgi:hypothetical protein
MTEQEVKKLVALSVGSFPSIQQKDLDQIKKTWVEMLGKLPYQLAKDAVKNCLRKSRFFPNVADILDGADHIKTEQERRLYAPRDNSCPNCDFGVVMLMLRDGTEAGYRCPCPLGNDYNGLPPVPGWALTSDRRMLQGEQIEDMPF